MNKGDAFESTAFWTPLGKGILNHHGPCVKLESPRDKQVCMMREGSRYGTLRIEITEPTVEGVKAGDICHFELAEVRPVFHSD